METQLGDNTKSLIKQSKSCILRNIETISNSGISKLYLTHYENALLLASITGQSVPQSLNKDVTKSSSVLNCIKLFNESFIVCINS